MSLLHPFKRDHHSTHKALIESVFAADAALDTDAFMKLLSDDVRLRIGSQPALLGHAAVRQAITGLFGMMRTGSSTTFTRGGNPPRPSSTRPR